MRDESLMLHKSLSSVVPLCDEIIIVDTGSKDNSVAIAQEFTDTVYHFEWIDDFSAARNFAQAKATGEYIMRWDADCVLDDPTQIIQLKAKKFDNKEIVQANFFAEGKDADNAISQMMPLIYKRESFNWINPIHNQLKFKGKTNLLPDQIFNALNTPIYHYKIGKDYRYEQTASILRKELEKDPNNSRFLIFYAMHLMFIKDYEQTIVYILRAIKSLNRNEFDRVCRMLEFLFICEHNIGQNKHFGYILSFKKKLKNLPRYKLLLADIAMQSNSPKSLYLYLDYLKDPINELKADETYDPERLMFHPNYTVGVMYFGENNIELAKKYFLIAIQYTRNKEYIDLIQTFLSIN
jgi:glycosyltransferase involved in cell wall biosynthesis